MRPALGVLLVVLAAVGACDRERVEVGESDGSFGEPGEASDAAPPLFVTGDGGADALLSTCGPPPAIGRCVNRCPNGYLTLEDGGATCECCP